MRSSSRRWPLPAEAEAHMTSELSRGGFDWQNSSRRNIRLNCPFPHQTGMDSGYNLEVTKDGRMAHCWVCDWSGSWNKLAKELGLAKFNDNNFSVDTYTKRTAKLNVFSQLLDDLDDVVDSDDHTLPTSELSPWKRKEWRGLRRSFLKKIPTYFWDQRVDLRNKETKKVFKSFTVARVLWPYYQYDRLVGYVGRRLDRGDKLKYFRAKWCKAKECFFPFDYVRTYFPKTDLVVLVEGEVDALRLLQAGIPALSILGSNNWGTIKLDLLLSLGIKKVVLLMDGDYAGRKAAIQIKNDLDGFVDVLVLRLSEGEDPGSLEEDQLEWLRNKINL